MRGGPKLCYANARHYLKSTLLTTGPNNFFTYPLQFIIHSHSMLLELSSWKTLICNSIIDQ
jgi:hypothetical protein